MEAQLEPVSVPSGSLSWSCPTRIAVGNGKTRDLPHLLAEAAGSDGKAGVFVVAEKTVGDNGLIEYVLDSLKNGGVRSTAVYDRVSGVADFEQSAEIARLAKMAKAELWVAVGGGAAMDACKAAAIVHANGGVLRDYCLGRSRITKNPAPVVCVPTTPGTGFEVTAGAVLADRRAMSIGYLRDRKLAPTLAVLDPEVTRTLPAKYVVSSGLTALSHGINALILAGDDPLCRCLAVRSIELVVKNLGEACDNNSTNATCRTEMLYAATMAALSLQGALPGLAGAVSQSVCTMQKLHFGLSIGISTLHLLRNFSGRLSSCLGWISEGLGVKRGRRRAEALADPVIDRLEGIYSSVGVKLTYRDYGFSDAQTNMEELVQRSLANPSMGYCSNPLLPSADELKQFLEGCVG